MDNIACMYYINKQGEARFHSLYSEALKMWNWCIQNISISAACLPRPQNTTTDALSRMFSHDQEWEQDMRALQPIFN